MTNTFVVDAKGKKTAVIIPIKEYEELLHQHHLDLELSDEYKLMIDNMIDKENKNKAKYVPFKTIKERFSSK